jgi:hypothetical protein
MKNPCLTGEAAVGNSPRPKKASQSYAVINLEGIEVYSGDYESCKDYATNPETDRIDPSLSIVPIF